MFLPGVHYQDTAWPLVKSALGLAALAAFKKIGVKRLLDDARFDGNLTEMRESMCETLTGMRRWLESTDNAHDRDAYTLAFDLVLALTPYYRFDPMAQSRDHSERSTWPIDLRPKFFVSMLKKLNDASDLETENVLRKIANDVFGSLRDEVDAQGFRAATGETFDAQGLRVAHGETMSATRMMNIRKVEKASNAVKAVLANWASEPEFASIILDHPVLAEPIEHRHLLKGGRCKAEWLLRWSEHLGRFSGEQGSAPADGKGKAIVGPFHTKSKGFTASVENIARFLRLIDPHNGRYQNPNTGAVNIDDSQDVIGALPIDDLQDVLRMLRDDAVNDDEHAFRSPAVTNEPETETGSVEEGWGEESEPEELGIPDIPDDDSEHEAGDEGEFAATPCNEWVPPDGISGNQDDGGDAMAKADSSNVWAGLRIYLQTFPLPIQVGVLRDLSANLDSDCLLDAIDEMGVFEAWGLDHDVDLLSNVKLGSMMPRMKNGKSVSGATMGNRIAKAKRQFLERVAQARGLAIDAAPAALENEHE